MSSMKDLAKTFLGRIRCGLAAVSADKGVYIGSNVHFECGDQYVYENSSEARLEVDSIPNVDKSIFVLNDRLLDSTFSENEWRELKQRTFCHKLSYKFAHEERTGEGLTYFGKLVQEGRVP